MKLDELMNEGDVVDFKPRANMSKLKRILAAPIGGNASVDAELMAWIDEFLTDPDNAMEDKIAAMQKLDQVMGLDMDVNARSVQEYIADATG